ncbi:MAG: ethanolamine permease [Bdellovibrionales bacterium]|jgi:ethanolamine permease|nr:ethanolamine permease [Bdellovibrionales bacterium]
MSNDSSLDRSLGPLMLWGLGVGYVISGMYFGWNLGLPAGGTLGLAIATFFIIIMYVTFTFSYTELACAIPKAGGAFDYSTRALGSNWGFLGGMSQIIEFVFAPPAIAIAIGAFINTKYPDIDIRIIAIIAYFLFTFINIIGVKAAASFELVITVLAVIELLIFAGVTLPHFEFSNLQINAFPNGVSGIFAAIPFAIWFFLAIEGVANVAEETINPQRNVLIGFGTAILTLVILCILTFLSSIGIAGWEAIVYPGGTTVATDAPLLAALKTLLGENHFLYNLLISVGLLGLVASFHGIILAAGRATFEFGRVGYAPRILGKTHKRFRTPAFALIVNMLIGIIAIMTGKTADIITIACFGAVGLYIISMISFFKLRKNEPNMHRPFKVPFYPLFPILALVISSIAMVALIVHNLALAGIFFGILILSMLWFNFFVSDEIKQEALKWKMG